MRGLSLEWSRADPHITPVPRRRPETRGNGEWAKTGQLACVGCALPFAEGFVMSDVEKKAYDIKSFCKAYSISRTLTYREIASGRLQILKLGRKTLITRQAAENWLQLRQSARPIEPSESQVPLAPRPLRVSSGRAVAVSSGGRARRVKPTKSKLVSQIAQRQVAALPAPKPTQPATQVPTRRATHPTTRRKRRRSPWFTRSIFANLHLDEMLWRLLDDPDPRLRTYIYRIVGGELIKPAVYVGLPFTDLMEWLQSRFGTAEFGILIRRGPTIILSGAIAVEIPHRS